MSLWQGMVLNWGESRVEPDKFLDCGAFTDCTRAILIKRGVADDKTGTMCFSIEIKIPRQFTLVEPTPHSFAHDFGALWKSGDCNDVSIKTNDGSVVQAHKAILVARCSVFRKMLPLS